MTNAIDIPLSPLEVANLVCRVPPAFQMLVHMVLLTGIKANVLQSINRKSALELLEQADEGGGADLEIFSINIETLISPIYITKPFLNYIQNRSSEHGNQRDWLFPCSAGRANQAWMRHVDEGTDLADFKTTAATHLLRHGGDAHVISANLGISLENASSMAERISPMSAFGRLGGCKDVSEERRN